MDDERSSLDVVVVVDMNSSTSMKIEDMMIFTFSSPFIYATFFS